MHFGTLPPHSILTFALSGWSFWRDRFQEVSSIRNEYNDYTQTRKEELRKVFNRLYGKLTKALGKEKMQQWAEYKQYN